MRAKYMTLEPTVNKYVKYIRNIRTIQVRPNIPHLSLEPLNWFMTCGFRLKGLKTHIETL